MHTVLFIKVLLHLIYQFTSVIPKWFTIAQYNYNLKSITSLEHQHFKGDGIKPLKSDGLSSKWTWVDYAVKKDDVWSFKMKSVELGS